MDEPKSIFPRDLFARLGAAAAPLVSDVRRTTAFDADLRMLVLARRRSPDGAPEWRQQIPAEQPVVVFDSLSIRLLPDGDK